MTAQHRLIESARKIKAHTEEDARLRQKYSVAKHIIEAFRTPSFYEISNRCNLRCEGCYFFDTDTYKPPHIKHADFDAKWEPFLKQEAARGVSMPYFLGAEPSMEEKRLRIAGKYFRRGNIGTNGSIFIDPEIPFRISISAWSASEADDETLRGRKVLHNALKMYRGDPRAIVLYTLNRDNIAQARDIVHMCGDYGLPVTFNLWSPTERQLQRLKHFSGNDNTYFRISTPEHYLGFSEEDLKRVYNTLGDLIEMHPETVIYSHAYNRWSTRPGPLYHTDADGWATDCGSRITGAFRYYDINLLQKPVKCCTGSISCKECRLYSGGMSSHFLPQPEQVRETQDFADWLDIILTIGKIFLRPEIDPQAFETTDSSNI